jgi:hypothetical protein
MFDFKVYLKQFWTVFRGWGLGSGMVWHSMWCILCVWRQAPQTIIFGTHCTTATIILVYVMSCHSPYKWNLILRILVLFFCRLGDKEWRNLQLIASSLNHTSYLFRTVYLIQFCKHFSYYVLYLGHHATSRKVARSSPDEVDFSVDLIVPAALWPCGRLSL